MCLLNNFNSDTILKEVNSEYNSIYYVLPDLIQIDSSLAERVNDCNFEIRLRVRKYASQIKCFFWRAKHKQEWSRQLATNGNFRRIASY